MESYVEFDHRSGIDFYSRHQEREDSPQFLQQQAQLPSFRDVCSKTLKIRFMTPADRYQIIPPHLHTTVGTLQQQPHSGFEEQSEILTPTSQAFSATTRSIATSPAQSQASSMPSLTEGFEEVNVRGNDSMFATQTQPMTPMDRGTAWIPASQYQSMSVAFNQPTPRMNQMSSQHMNARTSPSLPPLRDINQQQRSSTFDPTYAAATNGQIAYVTAAPSYPQMYSGTQQTTSDMDSTGFGTRSMSYDNQYARFTNSYPQTTRSYSNTDYSRFTTTSYDPYRFGTGYRTTYGDMNYSAHPMVSSQPASFGVPGDLSGAHNRRRRGNLPKPVTDILRSWFHDHLDHPYPSEEDKQIFIQKTGLTISQISNWFINARRRHWPALRQNRDRARNNAIRRSTSA